MDPSAQSQQPEQSAAEQQPQSPTDAGQSATQTNPAEQEAIQRGDMPMKIESSIQATQAADAETVKEMNLVATAADVNNKNLANDTKDTKNDKGAGAANNQDKSAAQVSVLYDKINAVQGIPAAFKEELIDRVSRLDMIRSSAGFLSSTYIIEYEQTSRYIDWSCRIPWVHESEDLLDLVKAKEAMDKNHYGLEPLKQRVLEYIASVMLNIKNNGGRENIIKSPILCMVGLAGTGKTTFAKSLADALGRKFERIPFGGMADSRVLRGQSRYFPDAEPGAIIKDLIHAGTKNPVILLDELDRVTDSARADIMGVLIEVLDPEQNATFTDHYIDYPVNLQNVLFVATANNISSVATAVIDRLEVIHMPSYNDDEKTNIGINFCLPKAKKMTGLLDNQLIIDQAVWEPLIRPLGYDPGVRGLDRLITNMCRKAATIIVTGQASVVQITPDNVKQFLPQW